MDLRLTLLAPALALVAACGDNLHAQADAAVPPPQEDAAVQQDAPAQVDVIPPSGIGDPCTSTGFPDPGTCAATQLCISEDMTQGEFPGGYCSQTCSGNDCPADATCITTPQGGYQVCARSCANDADCRTDEGYRCQALAEGKVCWPWTAAPGTVDGGACLERDAGPQINAADRVFGASQQLVPPAWSQMEAETHVVASGATVAAAYIAIGGTGAKMAVNTSTDHGQTFGPAVVVDDTVTTQKSDPVLAFSPGGAHLYLTWIGYDYQGMGTTNMRVFVARSDDGGQTWPAALVKDASGSDSGSASIDKPWIATGPNGEVYATYTVINETTGASQVKIVRSLDNGATWDPPLRVDDGTRTMTAFRNLAMPAVNAAGDVWVTWIELASDQQFGDAANDVYVARWDAGGAWAFGTNVKANANADLLVFNDPVIVPTAAGSKVYLVYVAGSPQGDRWDVRLNWSDNRGQSWQASSVAINDDGTCATHFLPSAVADGQDRLHVTWYDNRFGTSAGALMYAVWDPVAGTATPSQFVSDELFEFTIERAADNWLGDYTGLVIEGTTIHASWSDPRGDDAVSHVRVAHGTLP